MAEDAVSPSPQPSPPVGEREQGDDVPPLPRPTGGEGRGEGAVKTTHARTLRKEQTDAEKRLWYFLRDRRLGGFKFRRQHPVGPYIVDLVCVESGLIVELDGGQHVEQARYDSRRSAYLEEQGFRVLRFWNDDVLKQTGDVLASILDALSPSPQPSPPAGERGNDKL